MPGLPRRARDATLVPGMAFDGGKLTVVSVRSGGAIDADISYLAPGSHINRRFVAPGTEVSTGTYENHRVPVRDARAAESPFNLDDNGFVLAEHHSAVGDFFDSGEVDSKYPAEVSEIVRQLTGADCVALRGWMVRTSGDLGKRRSKVTGYKHQGGVQPPAADAHVDYLPARAETMAAGIFRNDFADRQGYSRFIASSLWRAFSPPPQDWPLALCDGATVGPDEGTPNTLVVVDEIPDRDVMLGDLPGEEEMIAAAVFHYNPAHRWWYFPNMHRDEVVLLKFHDSDRTRASRVPHTAFPDPGFAGNHARESIEFRTFAYFL